MKGINNLIYVFGICRNKLKEEITANTTFYPIGMNVVNPVRNVSQIRYDSEGGGGSGAFQQALENAKKKQEKTITNISPGEALETMAGLNQYDRHAKEIFFAMSSMTDYKC